MRHFLKAIVASFLLRFYEIQGFLGSFLILPFIKQQKSSHCKLTFMIIMSIMT